MADWIVMPVVNNEEMTRTAITDCLDQQGVDVRVLVVLQGAVEFRDVLEQWAEREPRLFVWSHNPPLPSLSATWNRALRFVWECGGEECLVVNNDVRLHKETYRLLRSQFVAAPVVGDPVPLFVSAVGVRERQFEDFVDHGEVGTHYDLSQRGGPDFSCFLLSRDCHEKYPFDEAFIPAYCEDLDYHRRLMLGGDGARIFSVNLPYLHYASQTLASSTPEERERFAQRVQQARKHYAKKWGGAVNEETYFAPFTAGPTYDTAGMPDPPTTPALQAWVQAGSVRDYGPDHPEDIPGPDPQPLVFSEEQQD